MRLPRPSPTTRCHFAVLFFGVGMLLGAFCTGCATIGMRGETGKVDPAIEAEVKHVVWDIVYGGPGAAPKIKWVSGDEFNCVDERGSAGFKVLIWDSKNPLTRKLTTACRQGFTFSPYVISAALKPEMTLSDGTAPHEMQHAWLGRKLRGDPPGDPDHHEPGFQPLSSCGECQYQQAMGVKYCRDGVTGLDCVWVQKNPCGECGAVEWAEEQLKRLGR